MSNEADASQSRDYGAIFRRRLPYIVTIAPAIILASVYLAFSLPAEYRSSATIMLEPSSVQSNLVETTVATYASHQIEIVQGKVMTVDALKELVVKDDPYPQLTTLDPESKAQKIIAATSFERVDPVTMRTLLESTAFSLHYTNPDPKRASKTASDLANLFLTYNQRSRAESAKQTAAFIAEQAAAVNKDLQAVDAQLSQLKVKYGDAAPDSQLRNETGLDRSRRDLDDLQRTIRVSEDRESLLALQLSQISPNLVAVGGDLTDLGKVKAQLAEAEQRYTPDHPDVKRLRRVMEDLIAKNSTGNARTVKPNNPEYLQIESQLTGVRRDLTALRASASRVNQQIGTYVQNMGRSPVVEKEFADINRRREALQGNYQQLQDRLRSAQLAQSFESESRGERFSLVRAPFPAKLPFSPNRIGLILLGLVLGLGLTAAVVAIVESNDTTVRGTSDLPMHGEAIHLGTIPMILIAADRRRRTLLWGTVAGAYGLAVVFVGISIVSAG